MYWLPLSLWIMAPRIPGYTLAVFSSVCTHNGAFLLVSIARPITLESKQSKTAQTYRFPSLAFTSVISVIHLVSSSSAWKLRFKRSSDFLVCLSDFFRQLHCLYFVFMVVSSVFCHFCSLLILLIISQILEYGVSTFLYHINLLIFKLEFYQHKI